MKPNKVSILGIDYEIIYVDKPSDVDIYKRESLWGQIDYWTRVIRIYDKDRSEDDIWCTIWHEILHGVVERLHIKAFANYKETHDDIDLLALAISDILFRNDWIKDYKNESK
jgi:hypothetical protein